MAINIRKAKSQTAFTLLEIKSYNKETSKNDILDIFTTFFVNRGSFYLTFLVCADAHVLEYPMLHTNFEGHRPFGSREKELFMFLPYMGMAAILVM